jgi:hypothetical protein
MSEGTFRAVVAAVLVGALALAAALVVAVLQQPTASPGPSATPTARPPATRPSTPAPTPTPQLAFAEVDVTPVGPVPRGGTSGTTLILRFVESGVDAIPNAEGSFTVTLRDSAGVDTTLAFTGTPAIDAPGSLGATADLVAANVLKISIVASDMFNIEPIAITGLGIAAADGAALGPTTAELGNFAGALAPGVADEALAPAGTVVTGP